MVKDANNPWANKDNISLEEAAKRSGLHKVTLRRLLRDGKIRGYRSGKYWTVSLKSLDAYTDPIMGFLLELPGPKLFLTRRKENDDIEEE